MLTFILLAIVLAVGIFVFLFTTDFSNTTLGEIAAHIGFSLLAMGLTAIVGLVILCVTIGATAPRDNQYEPNEQIPIEKAVLGTKSIRLIEQESGHERKISYGKISIISDSSLEEGEIILNVSTAYNDIVLKEYSKYSLSIGPGTIVNNSNSDDLDD